MKSFDDFLKTLTSDDIQAIKNDVLANREPQSTTFAIVDLSFAISLKLLEKYHLWLND